MEYTKNYHLPQWAEEDRILMTDFNGAMAAVEGGLTAAKEAADTAEALTPRMAAVEQAMGFVKLAGPVTAAGGGQKTTIDLGGIDLGQYEGLMLLARFSESNTGGARMYLNDETGALLGQGYSVGGSGLALLLPAMNGVTVYGVNYALHDNNGSGDYPSIHGTSSFPWTGLRTMTLETFTKGQSQYRLYGIKG